MTSWTPLFLYLCFDKPLYMISLIIYQKEVSLMDVSYGEKNTDIPGIEGNSLLWISDPSIIDWVTIANKGCMIFNRNLIQFSLITRIFDCIVINHL